MWWVLTLAFYRSSKKQKRAAGLICASNRSEAECSSGDQDCYKAQQLLSILMTLGNGISLMGSPDDENEIVHHFKYDNLAFFLVMS